MGIEISQYEISLNALKGGRLTEEQQAFAVKNLGLATKYARRWHIPGYEYDDLVQVACIGLSMAARDYDPDLAAFSTCAYQYMRNELNSELSRVSRRGDRSSIASGSEASDDMYKSRIDYREVGLAALERREVWEKAMFGLMDRERLILHRRFREEKTLEEIGTELGITRERVRQVEAKALQWVRAIIESWELRSKMRPESLLHDFGRQARGAAKTYVPHVAKNSKRIYRPVVPNRVAS